MFIVHEWKYYKEVNVDELDKDELLEIIKNSKNISTKIIYQDRYVWNIPTPYTPYNPLSQPYTPLKYEVTC